MKATEILNRAWDFISGSTLSCTEACLLLFLMNESGYSDKPFPCTNARIMGTLNINKGLLYRARNSLRDLGIISYSIGNRRSSVPTYGIPLKTMIEWERREPKTGPKTGPKLEPKNESEIDCISDCFEDDASDSRTKNRTKNRTKKDANFITLNSRARQVFEEFFMRTFGNAYYWTPRDAGNMNGLINKIKFSRSEKGLPIDDDGVLEAMGFLLDNINDKWVMENFSVSTINSKYNEIISKIRNGNGKKLSGGDIAQAVLAGISLANGQH